MNNLFSRLKNFIRMLEMCGKKVGILFIGSLIFFYLENFDFKL